jgi:hypothetical protein
MAQPQTEYQSSVEVGQSRTPEVLPPDTELESIQRMLEDAEQFERGCAEVCRLGYDHPQQVGTSRAVAALVAALDRSGAQESLAMRLLLLRCLLHRFEASGTGISGLQACGQWLIAGAPWHADNTWHWLPLRHRCPCLHSVQTASCADDSKAGAAANALALLSVDVGVRPAMRSSAEIWHQLGQGLSSPATSAAMPSLLSLAANLSADKVNAGIMAKDLAIAARLRALLFEDAKDVQSRCDPAAQPLPLFSRNGST